MLLRLSLLDGRAFVTPGKVRLLQVVLHLFLRRPEFREASEMIDLLLSRFEPTRLRELVLRNSTEADDLACRHAWLLAAIDRA